MSLRILTDSTCDLPEKLIRRYDIFVLPFHVTVDKKEYHNNPESEEKLFETCSKNHTLPKASSPKIDEVIAFLNTCPREDEILCAVSSSEFSSSAKLLRNAVFEMHEEKRIHIFDSRTISGGLGILVLMAAEMAEEGKSLSETAGILAEAKNRIESSVLLYTNTFIYHSGKCRGISGAVDHKLHPYTKVTLCDGKLKPVHKYIGQYHTAQDHYLRDLHRTLKKADTGRILVQYSGNSKKDAVRIQQHLTQQYYFKKVLLVHTGILISSQCGPKAIGISYLKGPELS